MVTKLLASGLPQTLRWQACRPRCSYRPLRLHFCAVSRVPDEGSSHLSQSRLDDKLEESLPARGFVLPVAAVNLIAERVHILLIVSILATGWQCYNASPSWGLTHGWRPRRHHRRMGERDRDLHLKKVEKIHEIYLLWFILLWIVEDSMLVINCDQLYNVGLQACHPGLSWDFADKYLNYSAWSLSFNQNYVLHSLKCLKF